VIARVVLQHPSCLGGQRTPYNQRIDTPGAIFPEGRPGCRRSEVLRQQGGFVLR